MKRQLQTGHYFISTKQAMPNLRKTLLVVITSALVLLGLSSCSAPQQDSSIPWSRPADWEGRIPGMGS